MQATEERNAAHAALGIVRAQFERSSSSDVAHMREVVAEALVSDE